jgi:hypothetical protein
MDDAAGVEHPLRDGPRCGGDGAGVEQGGVRQRLAGDRLVLLDRDGQSLQRARSSAPSHVPIFGLLGRGPCLLEKSPGEGVDVGTDCLVARDQGVEQLDR